MEEMVTVNILGNVAIVHFDDPDRDTQKKRIMDVLDREVPDHSIVVYFSETDVEVMPLFQVDHRRGSTLQGLG